LIMKQAERIEPAIKVVAIPVMVSPATVAKLRTDVTVLKQDVLDKQKVIDGLKTDLTTLDARVGDIEKLKA